MIAATHIFFAQFCLTFASIGQGIDLNITNSISSSLGAIAPDIDNSNSSIGKLLPFISKKIEKRFGHRTLTHSIWIISILITINLILILTNQPTKIINIPISFTIGYISHIILDTTTIQGVKILYPLSLKNAVFPFDTNQPEAYRIQTASKADITLGFIFLILTLPLTYISLKTHTKIIRQIQHDITSAVKTYNELSKNYICFAKIKGTNTSTGDTINGEFLIISAEKQDMILIRFNNLTTSVGKNYFKNDIFTNNIITIPKIKASTNIINLSIENQSLSNYFHNTETDSLIYLSGKIELYEPISIQKPTTKYNSIKQTSKTTILINNAPLDLLKQLNLTNKNIKKANITAKLLKIHQENITPNHITKITTQTIQTQPNENLKLLIKPGQQIYKNQIIALKISTKTENIALEIQKIKLKILKLQNKINLYEKKLTEDTTQINNQINNLYTQLNETQNLISKNLLPEKASQQIQTKINKLISKKNILTLESKIKIGEIKTQIQQLNIQIKQKEIQLKNEELKQTITANTTGKINEIKQSQNSIIITISEQ